MFGAAARVYRETRKKHDQLFNTYFMRPVAAALVAAVAPTTVTPNQLTLVNLGIFVAAAALLVACPSWAGGLAAVVVLEVSYCFDCADGGCSRVSRDSRRRPAISSSFFTDELKALLLVAALARCGRGESVVSGSTAGSGRPATFGFVLEGGLWSAFIVVASAISLTNFRPASGAFGARDERRSVLRGVPRRVRRGPGRWSAARRVARCHVSAVAQPLPKPYLDLGAARAHGRVLVALRRPQRAVSRARLARVDGALQAGVDARHRLRCALGPDPRRVGGSCDWMSPRDTSTHRRTRARRRRR